MVKKLIKTYKCKYKNQIIEFNKYEFPPNNKEGKWIIIVRCPKCGKEMSEIYSPIGTHNVQENGDKLTFSPSLVCPHGCGWHVWLKNSVIIDC